MRHALRYAQGARRPYVCEACGRSWVRAPHSACPGVHWYAWRTAPAHLHTYTQLRARHLKPRDRRKPDGCLSTHNEWISLYNERQALPRRPCSERQRQALRNAWMKVQEKYTCKRCGAVPASVADLYHHFGKDFCEACWQLMQWEAEQQAHEERLHEDSNEAIAWARAKLTSQDWALIDTETTALDGVAVEIYAVAPDGTVLFESFVKPDCPVTPGARAVHGITDEDLSQVPELAEVWPDLLKALEGRTLLLAYNADFDSAVLSRSARHAGLPELAHKWECVMLAYAQYFGEWSDY